MSSSPGSPGRKPSCAPPKAFSYFLEACGKVVLERAGAILEERIVSADR
jgi:hypothetical protein